MGPGSRPAALQAQGRMSQALGLQHSAQESVTRSAGPSGQQLAAETRKQKHTGARG